MTPAMSLSLSHRETWTTTGSADPGLASAITWALRVTSPTVPVPRVKRAGACGASVLSTPMVARIVSTAAASIGWFLAEKGSIEGGMIQVSGPGTHEGTYWRRVKMNPCAGRM